MAPNRVEVVLEHGADVGEGPYWDDLRQRLLWTDITAGEVHAFHPTTERDEIVFRTDEHVGAALVADTGELVMTLRGSIIAFDEGSGHRRLLADVEPDTSFRFNDAAVDPQGRLVAGTMGYDPSPGTAGLYRLEFDGSVTTLIDGVGLSNGMCWSSDGRTMYFVESLSREVRLYDYNEGATFQNPQSVIRVPDDAGTPDGMTIDSDGNLWLALWGGGVVWNLTPTGDVLNVIELPVSQVTSVAFAGEGSNDLFITSASYQLGDDALAFQPLAGSLFVASVSSSGLADRTLRMAH